jgi:pyruvate-ferredoxin/flavodoxin oxidoreductase
MNPIQMITLDANEAVASVAHSTNEIIVIYPITPSSPMAEWSTTPDVPEMQSDAEAIGAVRAPLRLEVWRQPSRRRRGWF